MRLSTFGEKLGRRTGIYDLMLDLGNALAVNKDLLMLGGGNPAHIPEVQACFRQRTQQLVSDVRCFGRAIGNYDPPQGNPEFIAALADLFRHQFGWNIKPENIVLTNGSQAAFFTLFNMFAGLFSDGSRKKILLPLTPEYIGYANLGLSDDFFSSNRPGFEYFEDRIFKYHVDFSTLSITPDIGAICVSRPTNPTGNVLTDEEIARLSDLARSHGIPLIIDNAYGTPFPNIIFTEASPTWADHVIVCMSLSKLGLPAMRTGIVLARDDIAEMLSCANAVLTLAPGGLGSVLALDLVKSRKIIELSRTVIRPFYKRKADAAVKQLGKLLRGADYFIHKPEGALFLWLWLKNLPITSQELYERLKRRGVLVVPGHHFFPGLAENWRHKHECIRITYSQDDDVVNRGLAIIADEVKKIYAS